MFLTIPEINQPTIRMINALRTFKRDEPKSIPRLEPICCKGFETCAKNTSGGRLLSMCVMFFSVNSSNDICWIDQAESDLMFFCF